MTSNDAAIYGLVSGAMISVVIYSGVCIPIREIGKRIVVGTNLETKTVLA